jgi:uncharacterized protein YukE
VDFFRVEMDVLRQFITTLNECHENLQGAMRAMATQAGSQLGTDALNEAADDFQHTWHYGVGQIGEMVKETTDALGEVQAAYRQADSEVAAAFSRRSGEV